jgi:hypothetical protein
MAFEPGGYADRLGNRYEGRWIARQLLLLLHERTRSVTVEAVGDDEAGVDLWIERNDGTREAQQCKAENGTKSHWTLGDLGRRGILEKLRSQLEREPRHRFTLVSGSPATQLRDLSRSAAHSSGDPDRFYSDQIRGGSIDRQSAFSDWCRLLSLSETNADSRALAFDLLRRSGFHQFSDDHEQRDELRWMAGQAATGDPDAVLTLLIDFAADNLRKSIIATDLWQHLRKSGHEPRRLFADERIGPRLDQLRADFDDSISQHLAGGKVISRPEVDEVLALLDSAPPADAVVLYGAAGDGKSGVLYQLTQRLRAEGTPFLAVRLDRKVPSGSPRNFGHELGLPESPANCLAAIAQDRTAVLILDQLDALRWTSSHATDGLEVCKALVREVRVLRLVGRPISVVLCCRTFDLEHDPQIRAWLRPSQNLTLKKVVVHKLPEAAVREFVESFSVNYAKMTPHRQSLLRSVQNLAIWAEVVQSQDTSPEFDSGTDLLRAFWSNRRKEIEKAGFTATERDEVLDRLVDHMESHAALLAPRRLIESHEGLATELQTLNVIHADKLTVSFCHQSYFDFLIANRVVHRLAGGLEGIIRWIGDRTKQSLFRREQLRQALFLLAEENPAELSETLDRLLSTDDVRFHIKQLAIEAIGQLRPTPALAERVIAMVSSQEWQAHVISDVLSGNLDWMKSFHESGCLFDWLLSPDGSKTSAAVWLLISVVQTMPSLVEAALSATKEARVERRLRTLLLYSGVSEEPESVFAFRLECLSDDGESTYVAWKDLARQHPTRAIRLLGTYLDQRTRNATRTHRRGRLETNGKDDIEAIVEAARSCPRLTIRILGPILKSTAQRKAREWRAWKTRERSDAEVTFPQTRFPSILLLSVDAAMLSLATRFPNRFVRLNRRLEGIRSRSLQELLVRAWSAMPFEYADTAIHWLLSARSRLRCGSTRRRPRWCAAARLVKRMSPHCSDATYTRLEAALLRYRDPDEKRFGPVWLRDVRRGSFRNEFGAAQRFLLPALDVARRSLETIGRIGVLERKFAVYPAGFLIRQRSRGGFVRSPMRHEAINQISDKQWLRLICNGRIPKRGGPWTSRRKPGNGLAESSIEMFARDLGLAAKRQPGRFANLALKIPDDAPLDYIAAVFEGLQIVQPPSEVPECERQDWQPATRECVEDLLQSVPLHNDANSARSFCWLLYKRTDVCPSERIIAHLIQLTEHPHPEGDELVVGCDKSASEVGIHSLEENAINCVRSLAAITIGSILDDHPDLFPRVRSALERLLHDPHPAVRMAMVGVCLPLWRIDRSLAVEWFVELITDDLRLACGGHAQQLCNVLFPEFAERLNPLIWSMSESSEAEIAEEGAMEATARWLFFDLLGDLVEKCLSGTEPQRKGVARIATNFVGEVQYSEKCRQLLLQLGDDGSDEVTGEVSKALQNVRILSLPGINPFLSSFVQTQAFKDSPGGLLHAFDQHPGSLTSFSQEIFTTVSRSIDALRNPKPKPHSHAPLMDRQLITVLLRLYEQAGGSDAEIRSRCLDMFDNLLEKRLAPARSLLGDIER